MYHPLFGVFFVVHVAGSVNFLFYSDPHCEKKELLNVLMVFVCPLDLRKPEPEFKINRVLIEGLKDVMMSFELAFGLSHQISS